MHLELKNIHKSFDHQLIFNHLCFDFSKCGFYLITGKSGSGKSTLINIIAGYEGYDDGERIVDSRIGIACVFQSYELIEELTVEENIEMVSDQFHDDGLLKQLGIEDLLQRYPSELSQGQKQRVGIARALSCHPDIIICDEPTESLDIHNKEKVLELLKNLAQNHIVIIASHEIDLLQNYYDYHYEINNHMLTLKEQHHQLAEIQTTDTQNDVIQSKVHKIVHKIINKKTVLQILFMSILIIFQLIMFQLGTTLFQEIETHNIVNRNSIYVKTHGRETDSLVKYSQSQRPLLEFGSVSVGNKLIKMNIYPQSKDDSLSQMNLQKNEIMINQNVANILKSEWNISDQKLINHELVLNYYIGQSQYSLSCQIINVVEEDVADLKQIYYSYEGINDLLKQKVFSNDFPTQYDYYIQNSEFIELQCGDQVRENFESLLKDGRFSIQHSLFSQQQDNLGQKSLYSFLFTTIQVLLFIVTVIYIVYITWKDTVSHLTSLSIVHASGVPMRQVKKVYFIEKLKYILSMMLLIVVIWLLFQILTQQSPNGIYVVIYIIGCCILYLSVLGIKLYRLHQKDISIILKEGKDD